MEKPKVAFFALTSCEGCEFILLDFGEKFFDFLKEVDLIDFSFVEQMPFPKMKIEIDVSFVEVLPIKKEEIDLLKKIRKESKILVAVRNCASFGGIPEMKNY
jgi:coenzyme F420-reducing hydrogenase gamma subunit